MGLFWDLIQQSQISAQHSRATTIESRVAQLEEDLNHAKQTIHDLLKILEKHFGEDLDKDGKVG
ncbi:MAG: hypothetical protein K8R92_08335 [Planctomycetes bacterium]|nr:hypothetical protein [Planctomycetota bacterium]